MPSLTAYLAYLAASIALVIVPGPTVTMIVANSLRYGTRAGLINVAGTAAGLAAILAVLAAGLGTIMATVEQHFFWIKLAGAAYLVWMGIGLLRSDGKLADGSKRSRPGGSFFVQGFIVILSNPKVLLLFGALIPQFIVPTGSALWQTVVLGLTFMLVASIFDSCYALLAGRAGHWLSPRNVRAVEIGAGLFLVVGGVTMAVAGR